MAAAKARQRNIIQSLAGVVGLDGEVDAFDVLKSVAETLGMTVAEDGTATLAEEEAPAAGQRKRRRGGAVAAAGAEEESGEEGEDEEEEMEEEEEEEGAEGEERSHSSDGEPEEGEEGEGEELEDFDLTLEPVKVEDPRTPDMVAGPEDLEDGEAVFQWLISPVDAETFYEAVHEDAPLLVTRPNSRSYFGGLFSKDEIDKLLRDPGLQYQFNVDVTSFSASERTRVTLNYNGKEAPEEEAAPEIADPEVVWRRFKEGCSVRVLHPQRFSDPLWRLVARLESFLQCPVGCNSYLTPAGTQGFAPHWDDIDAFVLQVEGSKRWRLYAHTDPQHVLPRYSSRDFTDEELGECVLDVVLQPGDLLYMPRGVIHQAESLPDSHSLHLTLSANQQRSWAVFLEAALPQALREAAQASRELRRALPRDFFEYMGIMHAKDGQPGEEEDEEEEDEEAAGDERRAEFTRQCADLVETVMHHMPLDEVADQMAVQFLQQRLPPPTRKGAATAAAPKGADEAGGSGALSKAALVGLVQPGIARLVIDEEGPEPIAEVHHCMANRRDLHARKPADEQEALQEDLETVAVEAAGVLEFPVECAELLDILLTAGSGAPDAPEAVPVGELPEPEGAEGCSTEAVVKSLLEAGVLSLKG
ncbi:cupin 4 isoform A [Chlorella sorokiniana]|uniref:Bifunctional lysine-specific demethylase and histidyl-hydroxylase n=1 Tax=Chlorella sorokiniana TaxID=3076 RepID=A0A2P6TQQ0_CHLSO|nr:cupin 4 isoform A [Chlorella sorokiniana]|eukprot:PRW56353.1 cupin 4 isoform A [Chlorella sorokiniana]